MEKIDFEILNLLDESEDSEHFSKNFEPFCMGKIDFEIFNFLDESEDSEHFPKNFDLFLKKSIFENFTSVLTHFVWGKLILRFLVYWTNQKILSIFQFSEG